MKQILKINSSIKSSIEKQKKITMDVLGILKERFNLELQHDNQSSNFDFHYLEDKYKISLPAELVDYLQIVSGSDDKYLYDLFMFYSGKNIKPLSEEFQDWKGIPDYEKLINDYEYAKDVFVIANYQSNLFSYGIMIKEDNKLNGSVFIFCGENYKKIADSLFEFIQLYLNDSAELYFQD